MRKPTPSRRAGAGPSAEWYHARKLATRPLTGPPLSLAITAPAEAPLLPPPPTQPPASAELPPPQRTHRPLHHPRHGLREEFHLFQQDLALVARGGGQLRLQ